MQHVDPSETHSRRRFLHQAASSIGLVLAAPVITSIIAACETDETTGPTGKQYTVLVSDHPELSAIGGITAIIVDDLNSKNPVFISRVAAETFAVFSTTCTHQGCQVALPEPPTFVNCHCPCHGAEYSPEDGSVRQQPFGGTATDLPRFSSTYNAETTILTING